MLRLLAIVLGLAAFTGARGESFEEWQKGAQLPAPLVFKKWLTPSTSGFTRHFDEDYFYFEPPAAGLFGHLDLSTYAPAQYPLRVHFIYRGLGDAQVNPKPNGDAKSVRDWTTPIAYIRPNAPLGDLIEDREIELKSPADAASVAVWTILTNASGYSRYSTTPYSVMVEVDGNDGAPLSRERLVEAVRGVAPQQICLARENSGADTPFAQIRSVGGYATANELPLERRVYASVSALWLDDVTLNDPKYDDAFWRQVFFARVKVLGHTAQVQQLAERLGIAVDAPVLYGGLWSVDTHNDLTEIFKGNEQDNNWQVKLLPAENPFVFPYKFAQRQSRQLGHYSTVFLVSFTLVELGVIIASYYLLPGYRRVWRWALIPASAIAYTIVGLLLVHAFVDFRPELEIGQVLFTLEGWPEARAETHLARIAFENRRENFQAPAGAEFDSLTLSPHAGAYFRAPDRDATRFILPQTYGRLIDAGISYALPAEPPCHVTALRELIVSRPFTGGWAWDGHMWRNLGPLSPDRPVLLDRASVIFDPYSDKHDPRFETDDIQIPPQIAQLCTRAYMARLKNTGIGLFVAVDERPIPVTAEDAATSEIHTTTLVVHQFKLPVP